jgi:hypothetical protein
MFENIYVGMDISTSKCMGLSYKLFGLEASTCCGGLYIITCWTSMDDSHTSSCVGLSYKLFGVEASTVLYHCAPEVFPRFTI